MMGVTKGATAALGFKSLLAYLGGEWPVRIWTDSTASIGMCSRQGLCKVRRLDTQTLWIQHAIRNVDLDLCKIPGEDNLADMLAEAQEAPLDQHLQVLLLHLALWAAGTSAEHHAGECRAHRGYEKEGC